MRDSLYYTLLGFTSGILVSIIIICYNPTPETEVVCGGCGSPQWHSILADGGSDD